MKTLINLLFILLISTGADAQLNCIDQPKSVLVDYMEQYDATFTFVKDTNGLLLYKINDGHLMCVISDDTVQSLVYMYPDKMSVYIKQHLSDPKLYKKISSDTWEVLYADYFYRVMLIENDGMSTLWYYGNKYLKDQ